MQHNTISPINIPRNIILKLNIKVSAEIATIETHMFINRTLRKGLSDMLSPRFLNQALKRFLLTTDKWLLRRIESHLLALMSFTFFTFSIFLPLSLACSLLTRLYILALLAFM
jgi:hypothetical protein